MKNKKTIKHLFNPQTWVKIENRAKQEGKTPGSRSSFYFVRTGGTYVGSKQVKRN